MIYVTTVGRDTICLLRSIHVYNLSGYDPFDTPAIFIFFGQGNLFLSLPSCRHAVCIFYLVLRALDTVEDDMSIPLHKKVPMLNDFHTYLYQDDWSFTESREKDRQVLEDFPTVSGNTCGCMNKAEGP